MDILDSMSALGSAIAFSKFRYSLRSELFREKQRPFPKASLVDGEEAGTIPRCGGPLETGSNRGEQAQRKFRA